MNYTIFQKNMSEILDPQVPENYEGVIHPEVTQELEKIPSFLGMILVMPQSPEKITEIMRGYRRQKAKKDENIQKSLHEYYSEAA